jgi:plastocyanin
MRYLLLLVLVVCSVGILMIPNAFAAVGNERTITVQNAPGSSVPGCEKFDGCFIPNRPSIRPGDTVVWTNPDTTAHTATSGSAADGPDGVFDSSLMMAGQTFSYQFTKSGLYNYYCMVHPWMEGIIIVKEGPDWTPPPPPPPSKTSTRIILDPLSSTFKEDETIYFSGRLMTGDGGLITGTPITFKFTGFTVDRKNNDKTITDDNGEFQYQLMFGAETLKLKIQAVFEGNTHFGSSESQVVIFSITSSSSPSTSSVGGPTFLKLEVEADKRVVTIIGKLTDKATKKYVVRNEAVTLIPSGFRFTETIQGCSIYSNGNITCYPSSPTCLSSYLPNCVLKTNTVSGEFATRFNLPVGEDYSVQAIFHGNNQWDASKSLTQYFAITSSSSSTSSTSSSQPPTQSSESFDPTSFIGFMVVLAVIMVGIIAVVKRRKKTPIPPIPAGGGKRRKSKPGASSKVGGATAHRTFECPVCQRGNIEQNPNGSEFCRDCGWKN